METEISLICPEVFDMTAYSGNYNELFVQFLPK